MVSSVATQPLQTPPSETTVMALPSGIQEETVLNPWAYSRCVSGGSGRSAGLWTCGIALKYILPSLHPIYVPLNTG